jgi:hypothetical protein
MIRPSIEADMSPQVWEKITAECDGTTIEGSYRKVGNAVTVKTPSGSNTAPLEGLIPEYLAKMLLRKLAREGKT